MPRLLAQNANTARKPTAKITLIVFSIHSSRHRLQPYRCQKDTRRMPDGCKPPALNNNNNIKNACKLSRCSSDPECDTQTKVEEVKIPPLLIQEHVERKDTKKRKRDSACQHGSSTAPVYLLCRTSSASLVPKPMKSVSKEKPHRRRQSDQKSEVRSIRVKLSHPNKTLPSLAEPDGKTQKMGVTSCGPPLAHSLSKDKQGSEFLKTALNQIVRTTNPTVNSLKRFSGSRKTDDLSAIPTRSQLDLIQDTSAKEHAEETKRKILTIAVTDSLEVLKKKTLMGLSNCQDTVGNTKQSAKPVESPRKMNNLGKTKSPWENETDMKFNRSYLKTEEGKTALDERSTETVSRYTKDTTFSDDYASILIDRAFAAKSEVHTITPKSKRTLVKKMISLRGKNSHKHRERQSHHRLQLNHHLTAGDGYDTNLATNVTGFVNRKTEGVGNEINKVRKGKQCRASRTNGRVDTFCLSGIDSIELREQRFKSVRSSNILSDRDGKDFNSNSVCNGKKEHHPARKFSNSGSDNSYANLPTMLDHNNDKQSQMNSETDDKNWQLCDADIPVVENVVMKDKTNETKRNNMIRSKCTAATKAAPMITKKKTLGGEQKLQVCYESELPNNGVQGYKTERSSYHIHKSRIPLLRKCLTKYCQTACHPPNESQSCSSCCTPLCHEPQGDFSLGQKNVVVKEKDDETSKVNENRSHKKAVTNVVLKVAKRTKTREGAGEMEQVCYESELLNSGIQGSKTEKTSNNTVTDRIPLQRQCLTKCCQTARLSSDGSRTCCSCYSSLHRESQWDSSLDQSCSGMNSFIRTACDQFQNAIDYCEVAGKGELHSFRNNKSTMSSATQTDENNQSHITSLRASLKVPDPNVCHPTPVNTQVRIQDSNNHLSSVKTKCVNQNVSVPKGKGSGNSPKRIGSMPLMKNIIKSKPLSVSHQDITFSSERSKIDSKVLPSHLSPEVSVKVLSNRKNQGLAQTGHSVQFDLPDISNDETVIKDMDVPQTNILIKRASSNCQELVRLIKNGVSPVRYQNRMKDAISRDESRMPSNKPVKILLRIKINQENECQSEGKEIACDSSVLTTKDDQTIKVKRTEQQPSGDGNVSTKHENDANWTETKSKLVSLLPRYRRPTVSSSRYCSATKEYFRKKKDGRRSPRYLMMANSRMRTPSNKVGARSAKEKHPERSPLKTSNRTKGALPSSCRIGLNNIPENEMVTKIPRRLSVLDKRMPKARNIACKCKSAGNVECGCTVAVQTLLTTFYRCMGKRNKIARFQNGDENKTWCSDDATLSSNNCQVVRDNTPSCGNSLKIVDCKSSGFNPNDHIDNMLEKHDASICTVDGNRTAESKQLGFSLNEFAKMNKSYTQLIKQLSFDEEKAKENKKMNRSLVGCTKNLLRWLTQRDTKVHKSCSNTHMISKVFSELA